MTFPIILRGRAEDQLEKNYQWLAKNYSEQYAAEWYNGFLGALTSLGHNPERYPIAPENSLVAYEVREMHFGTGRKPTHRALYAIRPDMVFVLAIRHVAQGPLEADDL